MFVYSLQICAVASLLALVPSQGGPKVWTAPESFVAKADTRVGETGVGSAPLRIQVDSYTKDGDRTTMEEALRTGGYPGFLTALRKSPQVGFVEIGDKKFPIRYARQVPEGANRTITIVTDAPIFFVGGGRPDAKPRAGYELAVAQLKMDSSGVGEGTMAAAARVKPGGPTGVQVDQYADQPIKLVSIRREIK